MNVRRLKALLRACVAGHTVLRWGPKSWRIKNNPDSPGSSYLRNSHGKILNWSHEAACLLDLTTEQAHNLFCTNDDPKVSDRTIAINRSTKLLREEE